MILSFKQIKHMGTPIQHVVSKIVHASIDTKTVSAHPNSHVNRTALDPS